METANAGKFLKGPKTQDIQGHPNGEIEVSLYVLPPWGQGM